MESFWLDEKSARATIKRAFTEDNNLDLFFDVKTSVTELEKLKLMSEELISEYRRVVSSIPTEELHAVQEELALMKKALHREMSIKSQKLEYDRLALKIKEMSSRDSYEKSITRLERDIKDLHVKIADLDGEFNEKCAIVVELMKNVTSSHRNLVKQK